MPGSWVPGSYLHGWSFSVRYSAVLHRFGYSCYGGDNTLKKLILFFLPLALSLLIWNVRNYSTFSRIILLEDQWENSWPDDPTYRPHGMAIRKLIVGWGGDMLYWTHGSMGNWFFSETPTVPMNEAIPSRVYTSGYNADSLRNLKHLYLLANDYSLDGSQRKHYSELATTKARHYRIKYQKQKYLAAFVVNKFRLTYKFLFHQIRHDLPFPPGESMKNLSIPDQSSVYPLLLPVCDHRPCGNCISTNKRK